MKIKYCPYCGNANVYRKGALNYTCSNCYTVFRNQKINI